MGQAADDMLNGLCCQYCGVYMDDFEEVGYPRTCSNCQQEVNRLKRDIKKRVKCLKRDMEHSQ